VVVASNLTADSFDVTSPISTSATGGVELGRALRGTCEIITLVQATMRPLFLRQVGTCVITSSMAAVLTEKRLVQAGSCVIKTSLSVAGFNEITRIQLGACEIVAKMRAVMRVARPQSGTCSIAFAFRDKPALLPVMPTTTLSAYAVFGSIFGISAVLVTRGNETVTSALDHLAKLCGYQYAHQCPSDVQETFLATINKVFAEIYARSAKLNYFNRVPRTYTLNSGNTVVTLEDDVQSLDGYIRVAGSADPIPTVSHLSEIERFPSLYPGSDAPLQAVFPNREARTHVEGFTHTLIFTPAPTASTQITVDVLLQAPRYGWSDYLDHTALRIPHRYATAIVFPLLSKAITYSLSFVNPEALQTIEADYAQARNILGAVDLAPSSSAPDAARAAKDAA